MKPQKESDQRLVERVQRGDKRAFDLLVLKYQHRIVSLIGRYINDQHEVLDVSQEAFVKAYRAIAKFRGESAFYTWLYRIAINTAKNHLVARSRRPPDTDVDVSDVERLDGSLVLSELETPEAALGRDQLEQVIYGAIEALPEELRSAITLRELEGMSYEEIAVVMQCPVGTIRSRIFRAREAIERQISRLN